MRSDKCAPLRELHCGIPVCEGVYTKWICNLCYVDLSNHVILLIWILFIIYRIC